MDSHRFVLLIFVLMTLTALVSSRAVNISNTWMLPEEGFPVFYRYFRDRISWYEADAVCQFHHANLVTADSSSQYDAIRAYLKELDITENVWIGLSKTVERPNFTWTDFRPLSGEGHWQQPIPKGDDPFCVAMDPVADFLWKPMACGGPDVASFICELPVPSWAMGSKGCLLTELPSLTVLYIPEQLALELTSDCGLDGTKRIACKGNADREEILKQLTCAISPDDFEDKSTKSSVPLNTATSPLSEVSPEDSSFNGKTTKPWIWTSNTIDTDYGIPTRHRRETEDTISPGSTRSTTDLSVQESRFHHKLTTEISNGNDDSKTLNVNTERVNSTPLRNLDGPVELNTAQPTEMTTQDVKTQQEEQTEGAMVTTESKISDAENVDMGEFPSAIGQGQLFSIIDNGTMFDIIELNETSDDLRPAKDNFVEMPQSEKEVLKESTTQASVESSNNFYTTTVVYHKEPPSEVTFVTNKSIKSADKHAKKQILKEKNGKKYTNKEQQNIKTLDKESQEFDMFPNTTDSLIKLNRTHRKGLPPNNNENKSGMSGNDHQHIEIKWHDMGNSNLTQMKLFVTTKRLESPSSEGNSVTKQNLELVDDKETAIKIDSKIDLLNNNISTENNESEMFIPPRPEKMKIIPNEVPLEKEQYLPKPLVGEAKAKFLDTTDGLSPLLNEPTEPEPEAQPRPNRQRQLTRPQRRSFYAYFFSRVLG